MRRIDLLNKESSCSSFATNEAELREFLDMDFFNMATIPGVNAEFYKTERSGTTFVSILDEKGEVSVLCGSVGREFSELLISVFNAVADGSYSDVTKGLEVEIEERGSLPL